MFSDNVSVKTRYPYKIPRVRASEVGTETLRLFEQHPCLIVEDMNDNIDNEAMFHLYNQYRNENGYILFTSEIAPARLHIALPDLRSRLNIVPTVEIREPDDELLQALIVKLFNDRQVVISQEVLSYILANMQRSYAFARKLVAETDNISLARKRAVTIPIVKEALRPQTVEHFAVGFVCCRRTFLCLYAALRGCFASVQQIHRQTAGNLLLYSERAGFLFYERL